jgi:cytochrome b561
MARTGKHSRPLVVLHWTIAALVLTSLFGGWLVLRATDDGDPAKLGSLARHIAIGVTTGVLTVARLVVRRHGSAPPVGGDHPTWMERGERLAHGVSYVLVLAMVVTGLTAAFSTGLADVVLSDAGGAIPDALASSRARDAHALIAWLLGAFVVVHVAAVVVHQLRGERVVQRMLP